MPTLVRLEYLTPDGWAHGHAAITLLNPQGYVDRLMDRNKFGRAVELDADLRPTGTVWEPDSLPNPADLRPSTTRIPHLPTGMVDLCPHCDEFHGDPFDGTCLI